MAVSFANIFVAAVDTEIINRSHFKPLIWKRYIDDVFSMEHKEEIKSFIELANSYHPTIKFTAETLDKEITFLDTCVYKVCPYGTENFQLIRPMNVSRASRGPKHSSRTESDRTSFQRNRNENSGIYGILKSTHNFAPNLIGM